jgi:uncharacterized protein
MNSILSDKVPSAEESYILLKQYHVPDHIIQHSEMVCKVAVFLSNALNNQGENINIAEVKAGALLHDITKMEGIKTHQDHAKTGKELLHKLGFKRIGQIVAEHVKLHKGRNSLSISEEELINYSDKRVMHTRVVTLSERFTDLRRRYDLKNLDTKIINRIRMLESETYELENKIFSKLNFTPEELSRCMVP